MGAKSRVPGWNWLLQRVTAVMLVVGLGGHFVVLHYTRLFESETLKAAESTASRFGGAPGWWLLFDGMLLTAAMFHAMNGVYNIVSDYRPGRRVRLGLAWTLWVVGLAGTVLGWILLGRFIQYGIGA